MTKATDPAMYESNFTRVPRERYFTEPWVTSVLLRRLDLTNTIVWEPCAGRGDMVRVLKDEGIRVVASDIDMSEFDGAECPAVEHDFFVDPLPKVIFESGYNAIITNPPYDKAEECLRRALSLDAEIVAMLLRSEFNQAKGRSDLFTDPKHMFAFEIVLTTRPRWDDWWNGKKPDASPRHGFSWFIFDKGQFEFKPGQFWEGKNAA